MIAAKRSNVGAALAAIKSLTVLSRLKAAPTAVVLSLAVTVSAAESEPTPPRETIARYHVTVTVQKNEDAGAGVAWQPAARDLRTGSGTIVDARGIVVTAAHIVRSAQHGVVIRAHDGSTYRARVLHVDPDSELAVLKAKRPWDFEVEAAAVDGSPEPGEPVTGIGLPGKVSVAARPGTVRLPRLDREFRFGEFGFRDPIVLDMQVNAGFSGGPVFDANEGWVGMIVGYGLVRAGDGEVHNNGQTYVLPAQRVLAAVEELSRH